MGTDTKVDINLTKVLVTAVILAATAGVGLFVWKKIENLISDGLEKSDAKDVVKEAEKTIDTRNLSFDALWYKSAVDKLFAAMANKVGTDEWAIQSIMKET